MVWVTAHQQVLLVQPPKAPAQLLQQCQATDGDLMTDEEFEKLLDQLHGAGNGPSMKNLDFATKPASEPEAPKPAPAPQPAPVTAAPTPAPAPA